MAAGRVQQHGVRPSMLDSVMSLQPARDGPDPADARPICQEPSKPVAVYPNGAEDEDVVRRKCHASVVSDGGAGVGKNASAPRADPHVFRATLWVGSRKELHSRQRTGTRASHGGSGVSPICRFERSKMEGEDMLRAGVGVGGRILYVLQLLSSLSGDADATTAPIQVIIRTL
jgi:hypothetical protein